MKRQLVVLALFFVLPAFVSDNAFTQEHRRQGGAHKHKGGGCRAEFIVTNAFTAPVEVWIFGEDGDGGYIGVASPQQRASLSHAYAPIYQGDSKCERCRHQVQVQYRVPPGYDNAGSILCVDRLWLNPCHVRETNFWAPQSCGQPAK